MLFCQIVVGYYRGLGNRGDGMARTKGSSQRREQIIKATVDCIVTHGYHNFSMQDVATTAGVSKGIIHYYFLNKDDLMMAILDRSAVDIEDMLMARMDAVHDPLSKLEAFISVCFDVLRTKKEYYQVNMDFWTQINQKEAVRRVVARHYEKFRSAAAEVISSGIAQGVFRDLDARMYASYIVAVADGFSLQFLFDPTVFDYERSVSSIVEIVVAGVRKTGAV